MTKKLTVQTHRLYHFGWQRDLPDHRDHLFSAPAPILLKLPPKVDLRPHCPPVYDQGHLGSCTANAIGGAMQFLLKKERKRSFVPSRLFIYYNERALEGSVGEDRGAQLRDGVKVVNTFGVCPEPTWPYIVEHFAEKPSRESYTKARRPATAAAPG